MYFIHGRNFFTKQFFMYYAKTYNILAKQRAAKKMKMKDIFNIFVGKTIS